MRGMIDFQQWGIDGNMNLLVNFSLIIKSVMKNQFLILK